jgi:hypothetical protein
MTSGGSTMKAVRIGAILVGAGLMAWALISCSLNAVSIDQRISDFQSDLNTTDRSNVYQDFHPTMTASYDPLKDPITSGFNTAYLPPGPSFSLSVVDESNPSSGVIVKVNSGLSGTWGTPFYMLLTMATYNGNDWRIVTLSDSQNGSAPWSLRYQ